MSATYAVVVEMTMPDGSTLTAATGTQSAGEANPELARSALRTAFLELDAQIDEWVPLVGRHADERMPINPPYDPGATVAFNMPPVPPAPLPRRT